MVIVYLLCFFVFLCSVGFVSKKIAQPSLTEWLLTTFVLSVGCVIPSGFILSALDQTANTFSWILATFLILAIHYVLWSRLIPQKQDYSVRQIFSNRAKGLSLWARELSPYLKFIFGLLFGTLLIIGITNLILVIFTVPNEWDSMTGHLNRAIRYIQHGTMAHFGGTNWNMDTYP
ncbi:MAG TPA: hypothetical protein VGN64_13800, partial [Dyadobacter sp.]|nr:hypothetical protein [Dyadobacter sp.]